MSSLSSALALLAVLAVGGDASAAETTPAPATPSALHDWDFALRAGYGMVFTDGLSYSGAGFGGEVGRHLGRHLRLEATFLRTLGESVRASNDVITYRSSYASTHAALGAGYDLIFGPLVVRPGVRLGALLVDGRVDVGPSRVSDLQLYPIVGPSLALVVRHRAFQIGIDGEAFYVPTWPAAPSAGLYGFAGVAF